MESRFDCRIITVGHMMAGKTTVIARLLLEYIDMQATQRTNGIVIIKKGFVLLDTGKWGSSDTSQDMKQVLKRMKTATANQKQDEESIHDLNTIPHEAMAAYDKVKELDDRSSDEETTSEDSESESEKTTESDNESITEKQEKNVVNDDIEGEDTQGYKVEKTSTHESKQHDSHKCRLSFMDFAGQSVFNATHQMFMNYRAIYLLVLDISKELDSEVEDDDVYCIGANRRMTIRDFVKFLMSSIHVYSGGQKELFPKVLLIGTHSDQVEEGKAKQRMEDLKTIFKDTPLEKHVRGHFILDCSYEDDPELDRLRLTICDIVSQEPYWGEKTPTRWLPLEMDIIKQREEGERVLTLERIKKMDENSYVHLKTETEIEKFLGFHNALGNVMHFGGTAPDDIVILDPQWLVDALRQFITLEQYYLIPKGMEPLWKDFTGCGKLYKSLIKAVWSRNKDKTFITYQKQLLAILEQTDIIASPLAYSKDGRTKDVHFYFVPSMLKPSQEEGRNLHMMFKVCSRKSTTLCFVFENNFMPPAIFPRIQAECINIYKIQQFGNQPWLYLHEAVFLLRQTTCLVIENVRNMIKVTIMNENDRHIDPGLCESVRLTLEEALMNIVQLYGGSDVPFRKFIQCDENSDEDINKLLKWDDLMKFENVSCYDHQPEKYHRKTSAEALGLWIRPQVTQRQSQCLPSEGTVHKYLEPKHFGRLARRLNPVALRLAALPSISEVSCTQSALDNRDDIIGEVFDILIKWSTHEGGLTVKKIHEALKEADSDISIHEMHEVIGEPDAAPFFKDFDEAFLQKRITDEAIDLISQHSAKMYKHLALELGTDLNHINAVVKDVTGVVKRAKRMLQDWRETSESANYRVVGCAIITTEMDVNILTECHSKIQNHNSNIPSNTRPLTHHYSNIPSNTRPLTDHYSNIPSNTRPLTDHYDALSDVYDPIDEDAMYDSQTMQQESGSEQDVFALCNCKCSIL